jgi:hypothetical protein
MGIFDRFASLIKSNINDLISSAENPEKMLNQIIVDMRDQLVKAKQQVAAAIADEKRLRDQADSEAKQAQDWMAKAELAVRQNHDELAKSALVRHGEHLTHAQQLELTWQAHQSETEKLKASLRDLNRIGDEGGQVFYGTSFITDETGEIVTDFGRTEEGVLVASFDLDQIDQARAAWGFFRDRRTDLYDLLI